MCRAAAWFMLLAVALYGCGYGFSGQGRGLPGGAASLCVGRFENRTQEAGLESAVSQALSDEIARRGQLRLVRAEESPALVLEGELAALENRPVAFSRSDTALQYETAITINARLRDPAKGQIVWAINGLRESDAYGAASDTVITSSPTFWAGSTLNASDLAAVPEIQLSEGQRRDAVQRVLENASRALYNAMVEDF